MGAKTTAGDVNGKSDEMKSLAVSYMGVPLHFLASLVWAAVSRLLTIFRPRQQTGAGFNKPVSPAPQQPLVRLNNLPQSEEYFINERGRVIHFRSYLPQSADEIKAVVLFSHGYGAHCNSPRKHQMGMSMPEKGLCMYQMDLEGHGYSGGERAYIEDYHHWVDDYRQVTREGRQWGVNSFGFRFWSVLLLTIATITAAVLSPNLGAVRREITCCA
ncbi:unnamed protein product [Ectocarpus sp. 4 AP-2014]